MQCSLHVCIDGEPLEPATMIGPLAGQPEWKCFVAVFCCCGSALLLQCYMAIHSFVCVCVHCTVDNVRVCVSAMDCSTSACDATF